ncbi:MAG: TolC family protein, partial [Candidatus Dependentiae bacterium]|nr:TolC family protein [Candidatus Dependentiae bacterium]
MKKYGAMLALSLLVGCTKVKIESDFSKLQQKSVETIGSSITLDNIVHHEISDIPYTKDTEGGLTRNDAVSIALQNNPDLQADFQNLGIAKADLVQAGLYTNPSINSVFRFPTRDSGPGTAQTN